jgi:thiamine phosphate synthase YjbQ (UPF0047 family)
MKIKRFNENLEEYKSKLEKDLNKILDNELWTEHVYNHDEISRDGKESAVKEIINYLEKEGLLTALVVDVKEYNL